MAQWHHELKGKKPTGGIKRSVRATDRREAWKGSEPTLTKMSETSGKEKRKTVKTLGGNKKTKLYTTKTANIIDRAAKKVSQAEIVTVKDNQADKLFVRRNIITKGAIIEVKTGQGNRMARVTNRPGQTGSVYALLLSDEEAKEALARLQKKPSDGAEKKQKKNEKTKEKKPEGSESEKEQKAE